MTSDSKNNEFETAVDRSRVDLLPVVSFVLWMTCLIIGLVGLILRLAPPATTVAAPRTTEATLVNVSLSKQDLTADTSSGPAPSFDTTPPITDTPPLPQVVEISPAIPFAVPVQGPVQVVPRAVSPAPVKRVDADAKPAAPVFKKITLGSGEGQQPQPEYPVEAYTDGQEGNVVVRYRVDEDGSISSTEVATPCPWPLLNQAAARSIRETWHYPTGPVRYFEIKITYRSKPQ